MEIKQSYLTINGDQYRFGSVKINKSLLVPGNNRFKMIFEIRFRFKFISAIKFTMKRETSSRFKSNEIDLRTNLIGNLVMYNRNQVAPKIESSESPITILKDL